MLVDGVVVAIAIAMTGGYRSPLLFLVFLDVMAVTVLASYRTGLKLAIWCALLLLLAHAAAAAEIVTLRADVSDRVALVSAATFLLVRASRPRCSRPSTSGRCATAARSSRHSSSSAPSSSRRPDSTR